MTAAPGKAVTPAVGALFGSPASARWAPGLLGHRDYLRTFAVQESDAISTNIGNDATDFPSDGSRKALVRTDPLDTSCRSVHRSSDSAAGMVTHDIGVRKESGGVLPSMRPVPEVPVAATTPRAARLRGSSAEAPFAAAETESPFARADACRAGIAAFDSNPVRPPPAELQPHPTRADVLRVPTAGLLSHSHNAATHHLPSMRGASSARDCLQWAA